VELSVASIATIASTTAAAFSKLSGSTAAFSIVAVAFMALKSFIASAAVAPAGTEFPWDCEAKADVRALAIPDTRFSNVPTASGLVSVLLSSAASSLLRTVANSFKACALDCGVVVVALVYSSVVVSFVVEGECLASDDLLVFVVVLLVMVLVLIVVVVLIIVVVLVMVAAVVLATVMLVVVVIVVLAVVVLVEGKGKGEGEGEGQGEGQGEGEGKGEAWHFWQYGCNC